MQRITLIKSGCTLEYRINGGGVRMIRGKEWKWFALAIIGGLKQSGGGGCLEKLKIVVFLAKHVFFIIYLNSDVLCLFRDHVYYHFIF